MTIAVPSYLPSTTGRAAFGVYKAGPVIYLRELY
jgi:MSHA biogenesis protein MshQ